MGNGDELLQFVAFSSSFQSLRCAEGANQYQCREKISIAPVERERETFPPEKKESTRENRCGVFSSWHVERKTSVQLLDRAKTILLMLRTQQIIFFLRSILVVRTDEIRLIDVSAIAELVFTSVNTRASFIPSTDSIH